MAWVPDDDVVEHFDFEQLPGPNKVAGEFDVRFRWRRFARWVVVHEHNRGGAPDDRRPEHLARMHEERVHCPDGEDLVSPDLAAGVEEDDDKAFALGIQLRRSGNVHPPVSHNCNRSGVGHSRKATTFHSLGWYFRFSFSDLNICICSMYSLSAVHPR